MKCLRCERTAGLDRAVVDILTGSEVGGLCESCLDTCSSPVFRDDVWRRDTDCAVCAETPHYEIPLIDCLIRYAGHRPDEVEYAITDTTLRLCAEHLREISTEIPEEHRTPEAVVSQ
jgi:hypothetical protein